MPDRESRASHEKNGARTATGVGAAELNALLREGGMPVLAYVWAPWCPPCAAMTPAMDDVAARIGHRVRVVKLNAAGDSQALTAFGIAAVPALLLFSADGREQARFLGALTARAVVAWVERHGDVREPSRPNTNGGL